MYWSRQLSLNFLAARAEKQKAVLSSGEYLQFKLKKLEDAKLKPLSEGVTKDLAAEDVHPAIADALMSTFESCKVAMHTIGHYLPPRKRRDLHAKGQEISEAIARARAIHLKLNADRSQEAPENRIDDIYAYIDSVKRAIDTEMTTVVANLERIYQAETEQS